MVRTSARNWVLRGLVAVGEHASPQLARVLNGAANFLEAGRMLRDAGMQIPSPLSTRFDVFEVAIEIADRSARPVYLEFGVWEGESIAFWASQLHNPGARFVGFDSFEGLPEDWTARARQGFFSTSGRPPAATDRRLSFRKGWFADTVPAFLVPEHDLLIINIDCDLYSSAGTVLDAVGRELAIGDLLYFDEFHDRLHEGQAFYQFCENTSYRFEVLAVTPGVTNVLFRRVA